MEIIGRRYIASPMPRSAAGLLYSNFSEATFPASQPWDAADPLPVMRREMKLLLIEIGQLRTEVEQLRAKEEEVQNVKEFLYRLIESRDQWQREAQRLRALMAKVPPWLLFCGRCLDAFKASREGSEGLDLHQSPSQCP